VIMHTDLKLRQRSEHFITIYVTYFHVILLQQSLVSNIYVFNVAVVILTGVVQ
jgi:hypothetical protein